MNFKNVPKKYRPVPFWSWNEKLDTEETKRQVYEMDKAGMGGFFMHARGGLQTEYMSEEWFDNVTAATEAAEDCGMRSWAYDENGWPSGFGNGLVNDLGVEYQQKILRMEDEPLHTDTAICKCGDHYFYYEVNPCYVDVLDQKVIAKFLELIYQPYYERYGNRVTGFFTDEPEVCRVGIAWSFVYEEEYARRYGENILECLEQLFLRVGDYKQTRVKFWKMVTELFSESYFKQIYDWCEERGLKFTGHLVMEDNLWSQIFSNGACMPHYEYFHIPGVDWLGRNINSYMLPIQVASVAEQLGKEAVLTESYAMCGHNVSFAELKGIYEWQMVHGVNLLCQHLEGYSLRGIRKRDYPPAMYYQQPWWCEYDKFVDAMSRQGMILTEGRHSVDVLVLHPQTTAWVLWDAEGNEEIRELNNRKFTRTFLSLEKKHVEFHFGDETIMERHAKVENGKLIIGQQSYSVIVDPGCQVLFESTQRLLEEFKRTGGRILTVDEIPDNPIIDDPTITYTKREYPDFTVHYFVNLSADRKRAHIAVTGRKIDIYTGELAAFDQNYEFEPWGSVMVVEGESVKAKADCQCHNIHGTEKSCTCTCQQAIKKEEQELVRPSGVFQLAQGTLNCLTLDSCDYYFDGELQEKQGYVLNICERANKYERPIALHQDYYVEASYIPKQLYLVCETPEHFSISVNGIAVEQKIEGYFVDVSFQKIDIAKYMKPGRNTISFDCTLQQSERFYNSLRRLEVFHAEKNRIVYDMEVEAIYLVGEFSLRTEGSWEQLERAAVRYHGDYVIDAPKTELQIKNIEQQGYPFFCGTMELTGTLDVQGRNPVLDIDWKGINALKVEINGIEKVMLTDNRLSLREFLTEAQLAVLADSRGEEAGICSLPVKFTLINNLRNLLGPHHLAVGENVRIGPSAFFKEGRLWATLKPEEWNEDFCFVEMGL